MANYIFKKEAQVYLVHSGTKYRIDISSIEFSQSFQEKSYAVKTLHNQVGFEGSNINRANPAEFSFNTPLLEEVRHKVVFDRLLDCTTFDLYISSGQDVFKLEKCVIQEGTFEINKSRPLRLGISGEASKLSKLSAAEIVTLGNITLYSTGTATTTYIIPKVNTLTIGGTDISDSIAALSVEIQNDISWNNYNTLQGAVTATNAATSMFPNNYTVGTRVVAGSITKYVKGTTPTGSVGSADLLTWNTDTALHLVLGKNYGSVVEDNFTITNEGSGYANHTSTYPLVTINGDGVGATAVATTSAGAVNSISLTNAGSGYTVPPTVNIYSDAFNSEPATATVTISSDESLRGIEFNTTNCSFTNRLQDSAIYLEEYSWRMTQRPTATELVSTVIKYNTA